MANHFRQTAERLREIAATAAHISEDQRVDLRSAAGTLCRLDQIRRDLICSDSSDDEQTERLALELMSLLGLRAGS